MYKIQIPITTNSALRTSDEPTPIGDFQLRRNKQTGFVENSPFDDSKINYDDRYQNDQSNSPVFLAHLLDVKLALNLDLKPYNV